MIRCVLALLLGLAALPALAAVRLPDDFEDEVAIRSLSDPVSLRFLPDRRLVVAENKLARIRVFDGELPVGGDPALVVPDVNTVGMERGVLAVTVDPAWPARPFVYVYYTATADIRLTRFTANGDLDGSGDRSLSFDPASALHLVTGVPDQASNHNGGDLRFGPDGLLYVSIGDDEGSRCLAQQPTSYLGKILRLKVDALGATDVGVVDPADLVPAGNPFPNDGPIAALVWATGLRNPFRFHIDPLDGSLFVADVGKDRHEELNHVEVGGVNLGWPHREADTPYNIGTQACPEPDGFEYQSPVDFYNHVDFNGSISIIGGPVYRSVGEPYSFPARYQGSVFYADFFQRWIVRLQGSGQQYQDAPSDPGQPNDFWAFEVQGNLTDLIVGPDGALYYADRLGGQVIRILYAGPIDTDTGTIGGLKARFGGAP